MEIHDYPLPPGHVTEALDTMGPVKRYKVEHGGKLYTAIVSRDNIAKPTEPPDYRWHVSVAGQDGVPRWSVFVAIIQELRPGVMFAMPLPPKHFWMNLNERTLHVHEIHDPITEVWKEEGMAARSMGVSDPT